MAKHCGVKYGRGIVKAMPGAVRCGRGKVSRGSPRAKHGPLAKFCYA